MVRAHRIHFAAGLRVGRDIGRQMKRRGFATFETCELVAEQQASQIRRNADRTSCVWEAMAHCHADDICRTPQRCQAACLIGHWEWRAGIIMKAYDRLIDEADTAVLVTVVHGNWRRELGELEELKPEALHRWLQRRLRQCPRVRGIAFVDVSLNTELGGSQHWQGHIHAVLTGGTPEEVKAALTIRQTPTVPKPVMVKQIEEGELARTLAYVIKPLPEGRVAYIAATGRQRQRYVNVPRGQLREHDQWRMSMRMPARLVIIGMRLGRIGMDECR